MGQKMCQKTLEMELLQIRDEQAKTHGEQLYKEYAERGIRRGNGWFSGDPTTTYPMLKHFMKKEEKEPNQA
ncbi:MAG: hypothetical protein V8S22_01600 [Lachnospiraceae bacterium]